MIPIAKPLLGEEEALAARDAVLSGWVTQGPKVKAFEDAFALTVGAPYAVAVSNCTTALHLALLAVGVKPGDVVVTVSHSFIATANAARYCGAEPVFVDIEPDSFNMDISHLARLLDEECEGREDGLYYKDVARIAVGESPLARLHGTPSMGRVAAILTVHQMGRPCDMEGVLALASRYGIKVVEDAACAIGSAVGSKEDPDPSRHGRIGRPHGDLACFSFHPRKIVTTGEGGMITARDPEYDRTLRLLRQHGMTVPDTVRHASKTVVFEEYAVTGFNYRMTDIQASIGLAQLKRLDGILDERQRLAARYRESAGGNPFLILPEVPPHVYSNWQSYPVRIAPDAPFTQEEFMSRLLERSIATRRGIMNAHQEAPYGPQAWALPESERARDNVVLIPFYNGMSEADLDSVVSAMKDLCRL